jgi:iron complex transport system ATP-binding protein
MTDPELLLLDEPASGLDLAAREDLVDTVSDICEDATAPATVMVTHHVEEIPTGTTHILLLNRGKIVAAGPLDETLNSHMLSRTFEWPLEVSRTDGRWSAHSVRRAARAIE